MCGRTTQPQVDGVQCLHLTLREAKAPHHITIVRHCLSSVDLVLFSGSTCPTTHRCSCVCEIQRGNKSTTVALWCISGVLHMVAPALYVEPNSCSHFLYRAAKRCAEGRVVDSAPSMSSCVTRSNFTAEGKAASKHTSNYNTLCDDTQPRKYERRSDVDPSSLSKISIKRRNGRMAVSLHSKVMSLPENPSVLSAIAW